ncbi:MAG: thioesterase family protein [Cytophagales bacterium]|nr:thioesterase family protein [Cytophagales bacterium]
MTPQPPDRDVFRIPILVQEAHIDDLQHVNNVVYLQWVQDVAAAHWQHAASEALRKTCAWVVLRHEIDYQVPAVAGDKLIASTWVDAPKGPRQVRHVSIQRSTDGKILARAQSTWCLLDPGTGKPRRISEEIVDAFRLEKGQ